MVNGIDKFREFFKGFEDNYIIIGGAACDIHEEIYAQRPRATKDIDIILVVEALSVEFGMRFWEFVKSGNYQTRQRGESIDNNEYFRFIKPEDSSYPAQLELFSRRLKLEGFPEDATLTPVPIDDELSSLSAILMNDDYYQFSIAHSSIEDSVHLANIETLICLKSRAYVDLKGRKNRGENIDTKSITKHKNDIFRLGAMLGNEDSFSLPEELHNDLSLFCEMISGELPDQNFIKSTGLKGINSEGIFSTIKRVFTIK